MSKKIIALIGLMGAGKTTIGLHLSQNLGYYFIDTDQEIEDRYKMSITEIFKKYSESYFRQIESNIIAEIIARNENIVLSLGGGAFILERNRLLLQEKCFTVWLHASLDETIKRIGNKNNRPLLQNINKRKTLENLIAIRYPIYKKANISINTTESSISQVVDLIINKGSDYATKI
jgi:shikimate kinase